MKTAKLLLFAAAICLTSGTLARAEEKLPGLGPQSASYFYTGKPYDQDIGGYIFAARTYDPQINRWTTADPAGFPDGANCFKYAPDPTSMLDPTGEVLASRSFGNQAYQFSLIIDVLDQGNGGVGPIMTQQDAQAWGQAIASIWTHTGTDRTNGQPLTFTLSVTLNYFYGPNSPSQVPNNANAVIVENSDFRSLVYNHNSGRWARNSSGLVVAHEAGHMMGAGDIYVDVDGVSQPFNDKTRGDWRHTLMGAAENPVSKDWNLILSGFQYSHLFE